MSRLKKLAIFALLCGVLFLATGCDVQEEKESKTDAVLKELPPLPPFRKEPDISEPEKIVAQIDLPAAYSYRENKELPMLRNQNGTNTCWAFASLTALESSKDGDVRNAYSVDHLIFHNPFERQFENGGAYTVTTSYLLSWLGPVPENEDPFDGEIIEGLEPAVHVQEIRQIEPKDYQAIKRFVYLYGGVESALYLDFDENMENSQYYHEEYHSYCYDGEEMSNHDVVIVGWDDDYPAENFVGNVTEDGAFLCQNSWGEAFGEQGLFYVSYEDVNIGGYGVTYSRIDPVDNYDRIYQSDLCGYTAQIGYNQEECWFSNVYTADTDISLRAAGFYATGAHTEYEIYVVSEFAGDDSFGNKKFVCNGFLEDAGYYTVDFPEAVFIENGNDFAVIVKIETKNAEYPVAIECRVEGLSENADISDGQGYLSYQGTIWEHIEATKEYNICLKAYADLQ